MLLLQGCRLQADHKANRYSPFPFPFTCIPIPFSAPLHPPISSFAFLLTPSILIIHLHTCPSPTSNYQFNEFIVNFHSLALVFGFLFYLFYFPPIFFPNFSFSCSIDRFVKFPTRVWLCPRNAYLCSVECSAVFAITILGVHSFIHSIEQ